MRNIVILNSLHFSYPLPILMRVSYNTLIVKQNTSDYYKYTYLFWVTKGLKTINAKTTTFSGSRFLVVFLILNSLDQCKNTFCV